MKESDIMNVIVLFDDCKITKADVIASVLRMARSHRAICEADCNGTMTDRQDKRRAKIEDRIVKIMNLWSNCTVGVHFDGDPRGATVKLILPSERYNTMGGKETGWAI